MPGQRIEVLRNWQCEPLMDADVPVPSPFQEMRVEEIICPRGEMSPHVMTWQTIRLFLVPVKMSQLIGGTERRAELISRSVCVCERYAGEQLIWDRSFRILMVQLGAEITMPATVGITGTFVRASPRQFVSGVRGVERRDKTQNFWRALALWRPLETEI